MANTTKISEIGTAAASSEIDATARLEVTVGIGTTPTTKYLDGETLKEVIRDEFGDVFLTAGTGISVSHDDAGNTFTVSVSGVLEDLVTLGAPSADGEFIVATGAGAFAYESGDTARASLGLTIGSDVQAYSARLASIASLSPASSLIIGNGLGGYEMVTPANFISDNNILDTGDIGSTVQAHDADLAAIAALSSADGNFIVGSATGWVVESGATARTSLGLGNVENTALSTWAGSANLTTVGTIGTGTWQGTAIANAYIAGIDQNLLQASSPTFAGLTLTGNIAMGGGNLTDVADITFRSGAQGGTLRTGTTGADKFILEAYKTGAGAGYLDVFEIDAGNPIVATFNPNSSAEVDIHFNGSGVADLILVDASADNVQFGGTIGVTGNASFATIVAGTWQGTAIANAYVADLPTSKITSGTFADARIAASNVTQHVAAIDHDSLLNFVANEHIDWTSATSNFSTTGTLASGSATVTGTITASSFIQGTTGNGYINIRGDSAAIGFLRVKDTGAAYVYSDTVSASWTNSGGTEGGIYVGEGFAEGRIYVEGTSVASIVLHDSGASANEKTVALQLNGGNLTLRLYTDAGAGASDFLTFNTSTSLMSMVGGIQNNALPTSDPAVAGRWWNNSGVVTVSAG